MTQSGEQKPYIWWVGRVWIALCTIAALVSLIAFSSPLLTARVMHRFPDGGIYGPSYGGVTYTLGNTYASIDPRLVNTQYGVYYSVSSYERGTLRINDLATHELKSTIDSFGSDAGVGNVFAMAVSDQGDRLYVLFYEYRTLAVYQVSDDGSSVAFENAFRLPFECVGGSQMYVDPGGDSLTFVEGLDWGSVPFPEQPGGIAGCRMDAHTGEMLNPITWANDIPVMNSLQSWAQDPQTGDVYILGGGSQNVLSVVRLGSDTTQTLPQPALGGSTYEPGLGSLAVDGDGLYVTYDTGIYRYSTHDTSAPSLVWREPNYLARNPIALVRTTDHLYWWIVEERTSYSVESSYRYSLYSDSFDHKLTSVDGPRILDDYLDSDNVFFPSAEGHNLLIGSGETHMTTLSRIVLTGYFSSDTMVDTSLPRPFADLWNWRSFIALLGFSLLCWLSALGVRRREKRINDLKKWAREQLLLRKQEQLQKQRQAQAESNLIE